MSNLKSIISQLFQKYSYVFEFYQENISINEIKKIEDVLKISFPDELIWFITNFKISEPFIDIQFMINETLKGREHGLEQEFLYLQNLDEYIKCVNTKTKEIGTWSSYDSDGFIKNHSNIYIFLLDEILMFLENEVDEFYDQEWEKSLLELVRKSQTENSSAFIDKKKL